MTKEREIVLVKEMDAKMITILESKGSDYSTEKDMLANFKRLSLVATTLGLTLNSPTSYALFMVLLKIDRINNLLTNNKIPSNESVEDSFLDGINYFKLAYLCEKDK